MTTVGDKISFEPHPGIREVNEAWLREPFESGVAYEGEVIGFETRDGRCWPIVRLGNGRLVYGPQAPSLSPIDDKRPRREM